MQSSFNIRLSMKTRLKLFRFLISAGILLISFLAMPKAALADGMILSKPPDPYADRWDYLGESNQQAFINYENGLEKMILSIGMEETSKDAVWIFPVPSEPNKVAVDVVTKLPQLRGEEITKKAKSNLSDIGKVLPATQIYTIPLVLLQWQFGGYQEPVSTGLKLQVAEAGNEGEEREIDVIVYEHLEKEGITSEIITAKTAQALYQYLQEKGLAVEHGSIPVLDHYIGKEFTFIVSWITEKASVLLSPAEIEGNLLYYLKNHYDYSKVSNYFDTQVGIHFPELRNYLRISGEEAHRYLQDNPELKEKLVNYLSQNQSLITPSSQQSKEKQRGVLVTFPTAKIYYPLLPTSVYGSKKIPATIRIMGYTSPEIFNEVKSYTNIEYYIDEGVVLESELKNFYNGSTENIKYTKIEINAPSKFLTDDLWISPQPPLKTYFSSFFAQHPLISGILFLALSSIITGIVVGCFVFKDLRNKNGIVKLGLMGLSNCLSIIGVLLATSFIRTKQEDKNENIIFLLNEIKQKGYIWRGRLATFLLAVDLPFLIIAIFGLPSLIDELPYLFGPGYFYAAFHLVVLAASVAFLIFALMIKKVKPEHKPLFAQLGSAGYSSWSFCPKDERKFLFVPLFSVTFIGVTLLMVQLVKLAV